MTTFKSCERIPLDIAHLGEVLAGVGGSAPLVTAFETALREEGVTRPNAAFDLPAGKAEKALGHLREADVSPGAPSLSAQCLERATELQNRLLLGQYSYVAREIEWLRAQKEAGGAGAAPGSAEHRMWRAQLDQMSAFARYFEAVGEARGGVSGAVEKASIRAHSAACVLSCPHADCATHDCWESRRWCEAPDAEVSEVAP